jgi:hypothetical protein
MNDSIESFKYLWDGSSTDWVLLHINKECLEDKPRYVIVNTKERQALLIGNDDTYAQVQEKMLEENAKVISSYSEIKNVQQ